MNHPKYWQYNRPNQPPTPDCKKPDIDLETKPNNNEQHMVQITWLGTGIHCGGVKHTGILHVKKPIPTGIRGIFTLFFFLVVRFTFWIWNTDTFLSVLFGRSIYEKYQPIGCIIPMPLRNVVSREVEIPLYNHDASVYLHQILSNTNMTVLPEWQTIIVMLNRFINV